MNQVAVINVTVTGARCLSSEPRLNKKKSLHSDKIRIIFIMTVIISVTLLFRDIMSYTLCLPQIIMTYLRLEKHSDCYMNQRRDNQKVYFSPHINFHITLPIHREYLSGHQAVFLIINVHCVYCELGTEFLCIQAKFFIIRRGKFQTFRKF